MAQLSATKIGIAVICAVCGYRKKPIGRSAPVGMVMCEYHFPGDPSNCDGYNERPYAGHLWPGESEADFGYPVPNDGTTEAQDA